MISISSLWRWALPYQFRESAIGDAKSPQTESPTVTSWKDQLMLCRTLYGGWYCVQEQRTTLLPKHPAETAENYNIRLMRPTFYNAFGRTVRALSGTVFSTPPTAEAVPSEILTVFEDDIDLQGTDGPTFLLHTFNDTLITGLSGILVDMPVNSGGITKLEAQQLDLRPFWTLVRKDDIVSFRVDIVNGKTVLGQLVIRQWVEEQVGPFGVRIIERLRVFRRTADAVTFEAWERYKDSGTFKRVGDTGSFRGVTEIPFAPIYTAQVDFMDATPPLLDLATLNLLHYQVNSDMHHAAHIANVPIGFAKGISADKVVLGPNSWIVAESPDQFTDARWLETQGTSIGSTRSILADIEEQMSNLGLGMLQRKSRAAETANKAMIDKKEQDSTLAAMLSDLENGVELALFYHAQFLGDMDGKGGRFTFSRDFQLDPASSDPTQNQGGPSAPNDPKPPKPVPAIQPVGA